MKACNARLLASSMLFGCKRKASEADDDCFALCLKAPHRKSAAPSTRTKNAAPSNARSSVGRVIRASACKSRFVGAEPLWFVSASVPKSFASVGGSSKKKSEECFAWSLFL